MVTSLPSIPLALLVLCFSVSPSRGEESIPSREAKIVEGVDRVTGTGVEQGLAYVSPDGFYGPEALYLLHGECFTAMVDRYEYSVCPFENVTQKRMLGGKPTLLGVWGAWKVASEEAHPYQYMEYGRGQTCGHSSRKVSIKLVPNADEFGIITESVKEDATCSFSMQFGIPFSEELLRSDIIERPAHLFTEEEAMVSEQINVAGFGSSSSDSSKATSNQAQYRVEGVVSGGSSCPCAPAPSSSSNIGGSTAASIGVIDGLASQLSAALSQLSTLQHAIDQLRQNATMSGTV